MAGGKTLSLDDIVAAQDIATETVEVPEWGGSVRLAGLTGKARADLFSQALKAEESEGNVARLVFLANVVAASLIDDDGNRYAADKADVLLEKSPAVVDRLYLVAARLSGLGEGDDSLKETPSASSGSD